MTLPNILPCDCGATAEEYVGAYKYDNGWVHVECGKCHKLGPGEGSQLRAVRRWNEDRRAATAAIRSANAATVNDEGVAPHPKERK